MEPECQDGQQEYAPLCYRLFLLKELQAGRREKIQRVERQAQEMEKVEALVQVLVKEESLIKRKLSVKQLH